MFWQIRGLKQENCHNVVNDIMCGVLDDVENVVYSIFEVANGLQDFWLCFRGFDIIIVKWLCTAMIVYCCWVSLIDVS